MEKPDARGTEWVDAAGLSRHDGYRFAMEIIVLNKPLETRLREFAVRRNFACAPGESYDNEAMELIEESADEIERLRLYIEELELGARSAAEAP